MVTRTTTTDYLIKQWDNWSAPTHTIVSDREFTVSSSKTYLTFPSDIIFENDEYPYTAFNKTTGEILPAPSQGENKDFHLLMYLRIDDKSLLAGNIRFWIETFDTDWNSLWELFSDTKDLPWILTFSILSDEYNLKDNSFFFVQPTQKYKVFIQTNAGTCDINRSSINLLRNN